MSEPFPPGLFDRYDDGPDTAFYAPSGFGPPLSDLRTDPAAAGDPLYAVRAPATGGRSRTA